MERRNIGSGQPWESQAGFSRAVRIGNIVETSMTSPAGPDGKILFPGDVYRQTKACLEIIGEALAEAGASFEDVYRSRMYLTDMTKWPDAGRAHAEVFADIKPVTGWVGLAAFFDPDIVVEVEVTAIVDDGGST